MLEKKIYADYVQAMKSGQREKAQFLSYLRAGVKNQAISQKKDALEDAEVLSVLKKEQKRIEETRESGVVAGKPEVVAKAEHEIAIIAEYLPKQMAEQEVLALVERVISARATVSMKDMGTIMKEIMAEAGMRADARIVSDLVKKKLSGT